MKLNINLLPKKEPTGIDLAVVLCLGVMLFISGIGMTSYYLYQGMHNAEELESRIAFEQAQIAQVMQQQAERELRITQDNYVQYWQELNQLVRQMYINPVEVVHEVSRLLPNHAYISSFEFQADGKMRIEISFQSMHDAAYFIEKSLESKLVNAMNVPYLQMQEEEMETRYYSSIELEVITTVREGDE